MATKSPRHTQRTRALDHSSDSTARLHPSAHGGVLRRRRAGRTRRPISTRFSMHLVLRSSFARGALSFVQPQTRHLINLLLAKHSAASGVRILGVGNAGNHLHLRVQVPHSAGYKHFVRALTGELALKLKRLAKHKLIEIHKNFWDQRPFSSIAGTLKYQNRLADYIKINQLEGGGFKRAFARLVVSRWREGSFPEFEGGILVQASG